MNAPIFWKPDWRAADAAIVRRARARGMRRLTDAQRRALRGEQDRAR